MRMNRIEGQDSISQVLLYLMNKVFQSITPKKCFTPCEQFLNKLGLLDHYSNDHYYHYHYSNDHYYHYHYIIAMLLNVMVFSCSWLRFSSINFIFLQDPHTIDSFLLQVVRLVCLNFSLTLSSLCFIFTRHLGFIIRLP